MNFIFIIVQNRIELRNILKIHQIDFILLNLNISIMSRKHHLKIIRKTNKNIKIIVQTAYISGTYHYANYIQNAACNDYMLKPINKIELYEK